MTAGLYPCPECGAALRLVIEPESLQLVGRAYVVTVQLDADSLAHVEAHD